MAIPATGGSALSRTATEKSHCISQHRISVIWLQDSVTHTPLPPHACTVVTLHTAGSMLSGNARERSHLCTAGQCHQWNKSHTPLHHRSLQHVTLSAAKSQEVCPAEVTSHTNTAHRHKRSNHNTKSNAHARLCIYHNHDHDDFHWNTPQGLHQTKSCGYLSI